MKTLKDILEASILDNAISEASLLDIEGTLIDSDDIIKSPKFALGVKCTDIQQVADVVGKCVGQKIRVKKMTGNWLVNSWGNRINVDGCPGFAIEQIGKVVFGDAPIRKMWFAVWEGRLICKQEIYNYNYSKKARIPLTPGYHPNPKNYTKHKTQLGIVGSGTLRNDWMYHWGEDTLWDWLTKSGFERFFDKI